MANLPTAGGQGLRVSPVWRLMFYWLTAATLLVLGTVMPRPGTAATYACKNADGITEFRVTRCPRADKPRKVRRARAVKRSRVNRTSSGKRSARRDAYSDYGQSASSAKRSREASKRLRSSRKARREAKRKRSRRQARQRHASNGGFDAATCRSYQRLIEQSRNRGVEYVDPQGRSTYRKSAAAMRKLRKSERLHKKHCG